MRQQKILGINTEFETLNFPNYFETAFTSSIAYIDYDAVVIDTSFIASGYNEDYPGIYRNKRMLSANASWQIVDEFHNIKEQIIELLNQGKNVFVILGHNESCYIHTGEKQYSGTGKNARTTNIVRELDTYSFLPIKVSVTHVCGEEMEVCCSAPYKDFFYKAREGYHYEGYFSEPIGKELVTVKGGTKVISSVVDYEKGKIIFLPKPYYEDEFVDEKDWEKYGANYLNAIFELNERLRKAGDGLVLPQWTNEFSILDEIKERETLEKHIAQLKKIETKIQSQEEKIQNILMYKTLLTAAGVELENIVQSVLTEMGFLLCETERGRSDVIAKYDGKDIVVEIKGVSKSAAEKHAAQLEKWVSQFMEEKGRQPKALLIVNGFCEKPLSKRNEDVFPAQMLKYCEARGHALISTIQLLCLYIETKTNPTCLKERIQELLSTVGIYNRYNNFDEFLISSSRKE